MNGFLPLIEGFLAFALTMLTLAVATSAITGIWQRMLRMRARGLRTMFQHLYSYGISSLLAKHHLDLPDAAVEAARQKFLADMTLSPAFYVKGDASEKDAGIRIIARDDWSSLKHGLDHVSRDELFTRFRASDLGEWLQDQLGWESMEMLLKDAAARFDALGRAASEQFARRSRILTVIVGFALAFSLNIDSVHLLKSYLQSPQLRQQVIESTQRAGPVDTVQSSSAQADGESDLEAARAIRASLLQTFPVGMEFYPYCQSSTADVRCILKTESNQWLLNIRWLIGVLVTGLMIGLGAPFWVQVVNTVLRVRGWARGGLTEHADKKTSASNSKSESVDDEVDRELELIHRYRVKYADDSTYAPLGYRPVGEKDE